jgi:hypothetical protein
MSGNAITPALRRMGYSGQDMTRHGFRTIASTCLNELGWHPDITGLQLAHAERNEVRAAYSRARRLPERRTMMQAWADYLDRLRDGIATNVGLQSNSAVIGVNGTAPTRVSRNNIFVC